MRSSERDDVSEITELMIRYVGVLDSRRWVDFDDLFAEKVTARYGEQLSFDTVAELRTGLAEILAHCGPTHHLLGNFLIDVSGDVADGSCLLQAYHQDAFPQRGLFYEVRGRYVFHATRSGDRWWLDALAEETMIELGTQAVFAPLADTVAET